jgi:hypothetical protein
LLDRNGYLCKKENSNFVSRGTPVITNGKEHGLILRLNIDGLSKNKNVLSMDDDIIPN